MTQDLEKATLRTTARKGKRLMLVLSCGLGLLVVAFLLVCLSIGSGVHSISTKALREHPGDKVAALMVLVESEQYDYCDRNRAIWALGQLGDARALALLQKHYTGKDSDEKNELSQYELKKAIALCKGATNVGAYIWRHGSWGTS
ncbi:MAG: hypothetical protein NTW97_05515 [Candidatus Krumholzibacteria bacterium]|nr:hypothetical protein [Candidatus Krumholzibacteria bacterium]